MSHTSNFSIKGFEYVMVHHNSDWSGNCQIHWCELPKDGKQQKAQLATLPAQLFLLLANEATKRELKDKITAFLEHL